MNGQSLMRLPLHRLVPVACAALALSGCASSAPIFVEPTAQALLVQPAVNVLLLQGGRSGRLAGTERRRLVDFLRVAGNGRLDALHLKVIGTSPHLRHAVAAAASSIGLQPWNIVEIAEPADERRQFAVRVLAEYYNAIPPVCPSLSIVGPSVEDNSFDQTLGCSTRANLALMVNDGRDLFGSTAAVAADGERAAVPVERYRGFSSGGGATRMQAAGAGSALPRPSAAQ